MGVHALRAWYAQPCVRFALHTCTSLLGPLHNPIRTCRQCQPLLKRRWKGRLLLLLAGPAEQPRQPESHRCTSRGERTGRGKGRQGRLMLFVKQRAGCGGGGCWCRGILLLQLFKHLNDARTCRLADAGCLSVGGGKCTRGWPAWPTVVPFCWG